VHISSPFGRVVKPDKRNLLIRHRPIQVEQSRTLFARADPKTAASLRHFLLRRLCQVPRSRCRGTSYECVWILSRRFFDVPAELVAHRGEEFLDKIRLAARREPVI
jgi:hypothetical protein